MRAREDIEDDRQKQREYWDRAFQGTAERDPNAYDLLLEVMLDIRDILSKQWNTTSDLE